eukprot:TRINITY_DN7428_c4_g1_i2.p1 TRINITY_DN7428_c4_g1~~TRINITY_DN7428_c4_g1_i2.p1  ORF type:complete len:368 (+),score=71.92 TRINITY_DN7428_c4_g1_i2:90-1193(+)
MTSAVENRRIMMLRKRLEQHTGIKGKWVPARISSRKLREALDRQKDIVASSKQVVDDDQVEGLIQEYDDGFADTEEVFDIDDAKLSKEADTHNLGLSNEMEAGCELAWQHKHKQSHLAKAELQEKWMREQLKLREELDLTDSFDFKKGSSTSTKPLQLIAGMDISFVKGTDHAVASIIVLEYPSMHVAYEGFTHCVCRNPYIPGFLAYREIPGLLQCWSDMTRKRPDLKPQLIMLDGNGTIHHRGFGLACHFGVVVGVPTLGVAKNCLLVDGLTHDQLDRQVLDKPVGTTVELWGNSGRVWGHSFVTRPGQPIYVSPGHKISLQTAIDIVVDVWKREPSGRTQRIPLPTRLADNLSRAYISKLPPQN